MSGIFSSVIFNINVFNTGTSGGTPVVDIAKTGTGGVDKPTGYVKRKKLKLKKHDERIEEFQDAQIEIAARLAREFTIDVPRATLQPVGSMSMLDVEREIGQLLRQRIRDDEDEMMLLLLMAAAAE